MDISVQQLQISIEQLQEIIRSSVEAGINSFIGRGNIRRGEAISIVKAMGFNGSHLNKWEESGMITPIKLGERNSPIMYDRVSAFLGYRGGEDKKRIHH